MLKFLAAFLMIAGGMAETDICEGPPQCRQDSMLQTFPETKEELQIFCIYGKKLMECHLHYDQTCRKIEPEGVQEANRIIATFDEICTEDTLLHAAVVDNLKCFKETLDDETKYCYTQEILPDRLKAQATSLIEEGTLSLEDYENNTHSVTQCIASMNFFACNSLQLEKHCGEIAMNTYIDIVQKTGPHVVAGCRESLELLPAVIRLYKLEEEKEQSIAKTSRKRK